VGTLVAMLLPLGVEAQELTEEKTSHHEMETTTFTHQKV
jgi:hypothetical protein